MFALRYKKVELKKYFVVFREKLISYRNKELKNSEDILMVIQHLVDPKSSLNANNEPTDPTTYDARSEAKKAILVARVRQYIERDSRIASNMNIIYGIIWEQYTPGLQWILKRKEDYPTNSKFFDSLWLIRETNNITTGIDVKINKSASLYHAIRSLMNMKQGKNDHNDTFKLIFNNIYETMELADGENILHSTQVIKNGSQASTKEK